MVARPDRTSRFERPPLARAGSARALLLLALGLSAGACDRFGRQEEQQERPVLTLKVATPEVLYWGGSGILQLTLTNEGSATAAGGIVQVFVPSWLEFGSVEPPGTAVTVVSGDTETTLQYQLTDSLAPGDRRIIMQHLRVLPRTVLPPSADSVETVQMEPSNQVVRARLLTAAGEAVGVEVQATLNFAGGGGRVPPAGDSAADTSALPRPARDTAAARPPADTTVRDTLAPRG